MSASPQTPCQAAFSGTNQPNGPTICPNRRWVQEMIFWGVKTLGTALHMISFVPT